MYFGCTLDLSHGRISYFSHGWCCKVQCPAKKHSLNGSYQFSLINAPSDYEFHSWNGISLSMEAMNDLWEAVVEGAIDTTVRSRSYIQVPQISDKIYLY